MVLASLAGPALAQDAPLPPTSADAPATPADAPPPAAARPPGPDVTALQTRLQALEQRTQVLEVERARLLSQPAPKPAAAVTADETGFALTSADKQYQFRLKGQFQVDGRRFFGDTALRVERHVPGPPRAADRRRHGVRVDRLLRGARLRQQRARPCTTRTWTRTPGPGCGCGSASSRGRSASSVCSRTRTWSSSSARWTRTSAHSARSACSCGATSPAGWSTGTSVSSTATRTTALNDIDSNHAKTFAGRLFVQPFVLAAAPDCGPSGRRHRRVERQREGIRGRTPG